MRLSCKRISASAYELTLQVSPRAGQAVGVPGKGNVVVRRDRERLTIVSGSTEGFLDAPASAEVCIPLLKHPRMHLSDGDGDSHHPLCQELQPLQDLDDDRNSNCFYSSP